MPYNTSYKGGMNQIKDLFRGPEMFALNHKLIYHSRCSNTTYLMLQDSVVRLRNIGWPDRNSIVQ